MLKMPHGVQEEDATRDTIWKFETKLGDNSSFEGLGSEFGGKKCIFSVVLVRVCIFDLVKRLDSLWLQEIRVHNNVELLV